MLRHAVQEHCLIVALYGTVSCTVPTAACCSAVSCTCAAEYLHDPETIKAEARVQQRAKERELLAARSRAWRPGGQVKTDATRSIMRMNL